MPYYSENLDNLAVFVRNINDLGKKSSEIARTFQDNVESLILNRVGFGNFTGGVWSDKPYSNNPIKAYKLGNVSITGSGENRDMSINGIIIDKDDWAWGGLQRDGSIKTEGGTFISDFYMAPAPLGVGGDFNSHRTAKPTPVFIPGYKDWVVRYNGLSRVVDLDFTGSMLDNFSVDMRKAKGSNQYGSVYEFTFEVNQPFESIGEMTNFYRNWLGITEDDLEKEIRLMENSVTSIFI
jgi:hypothetical protein